MSKKKANFLVLSFRKNIIPTLFVLFTICLVIFSKDNLAAAKDGLKLWANSVVPSLFPFFIATELLGYTNIIPAFGKLCTRIMRPLFNVPGEGAHAFIMGIVSGYPIGAKIVTKFREEGICSKAEAERLLAFTNNSGPLFILGTVGVTLYCDTTIGILLLVTHLLACVSVGIIFRFWKRSNTPETTISSTPTSKSPRQLVTFSNLGEVLASSITSATSTILMIGGFIVLFSVVISILKQSGMISLASTLISPLLNTLGIGSKFSEGLITGFLELTNGVKQVSQIANRSISINIILCSFLLGFGGISVLLQVYSVISKTDISILPYLLGKLLQASFAAMYTFLLIHFFPFLNLDLAPVFANNASPIPSLSFSIGNIFILFAVLLLLFTILQSKRFSYHKKKIRS